MDKKYNPHITSYDYDAPISEAGSTHQPGIGGPSKFKVPPPSLSPRAHAHTHTYTHLRSHEHKRCTHITRMHLA